MYCVVFEKFGVQERGHVAEGVSGFPYPLPANVRVGQRLSHKRFLPDPFHFVSHACYSTLYMCSPILTGSFNNQQKNCKTSVYTTPRI